jgi:guanyl-specific ribonuclease Sa
MLVTGGWLGHHLVADPPTSGQPVAVASATGLPVRALSQLPPQAAHVWQLTQHGGPFPYPQDGSIFRNREARLPSRQIGFYREYTVPVPGEPDRGPRRLIIGGATELYYTGDHYVSFVVVNPSE